MVLGAMPPIHSPSAGIFGFIYGKTQVQGSSVHSKLILGAVAVKQINPIPHPEAGRLQVERTAWLAPIHTPALPGPLIQSQRRRLVVDSLQLAPVCPPVKPGTPQKF